jgi:excisionase family DNA binding protein
MSGTTLLKYTETLMPTEKEEAVAKQTSRILAQYLPTENNAVIQLFMEGQSKEAVVLLPVSVYRLLLNILTEMSEGNAVALIPIHAELSTQEAADLLNVSRPYFVKLLEEGAIPYRKIGTRRRVLFEDLMHYKETIDAKRLDTLNKLSEQSQLLNLGY